MIRHGSRRETQKRGRGVREGKEEVNMVKIHCVHENAIMKPLLYIIYAKQFLNALLKLKLN